MYYTFALIINLFNTKSMKKVFKIFGYSLLVIVLIVVGLITYVKLALPNVGPAPELKVEATPERIERGKYLI